MFFKYKKLRTVFYLSAIILFIIRWNYGLLLYQLWGNPVFYTSKDLTFLIVDSFPILRSILQNYYVAYLIDIVLFASAIVALYKPKSNKIPLVFSIVLFFYIVVYYSTHGVHHSLVGLFFMSIPFVFCHQKYFETALTWVRLSVIWVYFSAGLWKVIRGAFLFSGYFSTIIKEHYGLQMFTNPNSFGNKIRWFVADNITLSDAMFNSLILLELLFVIAFFTQKFDKILAVFALVFMSFTWFFADTYFFDFAPALLPFFLKPSNVDLTAKKFFTFSKQNKIAVFAYSFHFIIFIYALVLIYFGKYNTKFFTIYPFQNYYMYSDPYNKKLFDFILITQDDKCLNCNAQFPPQREVINANVKNYYSNKKKNVTQKKWIDQQITQKYRYFPADIDWVKISIDNER